MSQLPRPGKKALITGVDGFVGPYLKKELEANGYTVFGSSLTKADLANRIFQCDITERTQVLDLIKINQFDFIFHLAGFSSPTQAEVNPDLAYNINVGGTVSLLDAAVATSARSKVLIVSSSHVYGRPGYLPINEEHPLGGTGVYAKSRIAQEQAALSYAGRMPLIVARSFNHTGPGQPESFIFPKIIAGAIRAKLGKQQVLELGDITVRRDVTDVRDVVRAYRLLLEQPRAGFACNVCRGESIELKEILEYVRSTYGVNNLTIETKPEFLRPGDSPDIYGDHALLRSLIDWGSLISYYAMVDRLYHFFEHQYAAQP